MKKKLLKAPGNDGEILLSPNIPRIIEETKEGRTIGTAHQPYFFNPGVSTKFIFLDALHDTNKKFIFVDTDKVHLEVNIPVAKGAIVSKQFIVTDQVLYQYPRPKEDTIVSLFSDIEGVLKAYEYAQDIVDHLREFKEIFLGIKGTSLKEILVRSFLTFFNINTGYIFISNLLATKEFRSFFERIFTDDAAFRHVFNTALDEYRHEYRFRYKHFPFPKLEEDELPFWVLRQGVRQRCFKRDIDTGSVHQQIILPRASTLTIFLRLYQLDYFIHGIGGGNYEWVGDRVIENFFKLSPSPYIVVSGTFLLTGSQEREIPYFFYNPAALKEKFIQYINGKIPHLA